MSRFSLLRHLLATTSGGGGSSGSVVYDTSIGNGVDTLGITDLPLRSGARDIFVGNGGSDANDGTSHAQRVATVVHACSLITAGAGDQVLFAEGSTWNETLPDGNNGHTRWMGSLGGFSPVYPTCFRSYDPADPTNTAKYGRAYQRNNWPTLTRTHGQVGNGTYNYIAIQGLRLDNGGTENSNIDFVGNCSYVLIEANYFKGNQVTLEGSVADFSPATSPTNLIIRNNAWEAPYDVTVPTGNGRTGALLLSDRNGVTWEDNVIWRNGWSATQTRATIYSQQNSTHPIYLSPDCANFIGRRNLIIDPSDDGGAMRSDGLLTENVIIGAPAGLGLGPPSTETTGRQEGLHLEASFNLILAGEQFSTAGGGSGDEGIGFSSNLGRAGSSIHHNLIVRKAAGAPTTGTVYSNIAWGTDSYFSYMEHHNNLSYAWNATGWTIFTQTGPSAAYSLPYTSFNDNAWEDPASGSNVNVSTISGSFPNPYTEAQLYAALTATFPGITDKASLITAVLANPTLHVQRTMLALAFAGYGRTLAANTDLTPPVLSLPTASVAGSTVTVGATTNKIGGSLYAILLPAASVTTPPTLSAPTTATTGGLLRAQPFYYKVAAITPTGITLPSNEVSVTLTTSTSKVTLSWSAVSGATGYIIYRGAQSGDNDLGYTIGNATTFIDTGEIIYTGTNAGGSATTPPTLSSPTGSTSGGALAAATYYYKVAAFMPADGAFTASSTEKSVVLTGSTSSVALTWTAVTGATGYRIFRGTSPGGESVYFDAGTNTSFTDNGINVVPKGPLSLLHPVQVKLGVDPSGQAASAVATPLSISSTGAKTISIGSVPSGSYNAYLAHVDAEGNRSNVGISAPVTVT